MNNNNNFFISMRMIKLVKPLAIIMILAIIMGTAGYLCATFITVLGGYALLNVVGMPTPFTLSFIFGLIISFAVLRGILRYTEQYSNHHIAFKLLAIIRDKVFKSLRRLSPAKLETKDKGNLITMITTDIELLEVFYAHTISPIAIAILSSAFMVIFISQYHIIPGMIALVGYITVGIVIPYFSSRSGKDLGQDYRDKNGNLSTTVLESLRGLTEIMQFGKEKESINKIKNETVNLEKSQSQLKKHEGHTAAITNTAIVVFSLATLFSCIYLYTIGKVDFSGILIPTIAMFSSFGPVVALSNLSANLVHTFASARRVIALLDEEPETPEIFNGKDVIYNGMECKDVNFEYVKNNPILENINLQISKNKIWGISGKSGSGKSTLVRLLMRFWDVNKGEILISEENIKNVNTKSLRKNQGFVEQSTQLFNDSIKNNIRIAKENATDKEIINACKKASIHEFIETLPNKYNTNVGELGGNLSGGEGQRIGLARAFLHNSPIIFLDEPTSNLDSLNEGIILKSIKNEAQDKTFVLISHKESSLSIADKKILIKDRQVQNA